jgi:hypothetical protein
MILNLPVLWGWGPYFNLWVTVYFPGRVAFKSCGSICLVVTSQCETNYIKTEECGAGVPFVVHMLLGLRVGKMGPTCM